MMTPSIPFFSPSHFASLAALGEKALFAWTLFHSWKEKQAVESHAFLLPFSLNQVIRRLKIGKSTFYNKVLPPLIRAGLIDVLPATESSREKRLLVRAFPASANERPTSDEPVATDPVATADEATAAPLTFEPQPSPSALTNAPSEAPEPTSVSAQETAASADLDALPPEIEAIIQEDPRLLERRAGIVKAYRDCRHHPSYSDEDFIRKMRTCVDYPHRPRCFGAYLRKALFNEWEQPSRPSVSRDSSPPPFSSPPPTLASIDEPPCPPDVPIWIWRQELRAANDDLEEPPQELLPEQRAEAEELLRRLEALTSRSRTETKFAPFAD